MSNPDSYYSRSEVSNSDLTELKNYLYPRVQYGDKEKAFNKMYDAFLGVLHIQEELYADSKGCIYYADENLVLSIV